MSDSGINRGEVATVSFTCTRQTFRPVPCCEGRWIDSNEDATEFLLTQAYTGTTLEEWQQWCRDGYRFAVLPIAGKTVSKAATLRFAPTVWELAAVGTAQACRGQGYATAICSFVTDYILSVNATAKCHTRADNPAMIRVVEHLGYEQEQQTK